MAKERQNLISQKLKYFFSSVSKSILKKYFFCPSCGGKESIVESRKYFVTSLRRCSNCQLLFRAPTSKTEAENDFYQSDYSEGFTTDMPALDSLKKMKEENFCGTEKDYGIYLRVLESLGCKAGDKIFDYGCSWGYGSWQMSQAGYEVSAYEVSTPRSEYAKRNLGVRVFSSMENVSELFDVFFSCHVIEHVPSVSKFILEARKILKPGGLFIAFSPNGSDDFKEKDFRSWDRLWGLVHPNFLDNQFYKKAFGDTSNLMISTPYDMENIKEWTISKRMSKEPNLCGHELLFAARLLES